MKPIFDTDGDGVLLTTGATERNSKINIYDLAGNVWEWTLEKSTYTDRPCTYRGGNFNYNGTDFPSSYRDRNGISDNSNRFGFRPALY